VPTGIGEAAAEDRIHGVVGEPGDVGLAEVLETLAVFGSGLVEEGGGSEFDEGKFLFPDGGEVAGTFVRPDAAGDGVDLVPGEPAVADEVLEGEEHGISGESGERGVGRTAVAGGAEREDLP
jgi:hypothetical protein